MSRRDRRGDSEGAVRLPAIGQPDQPWLYGEVIVCDALSTYRAEPGTAPRDLSCVICRIPVSGSEFAIIFVALPELCESGNPHLLSVAVARHVSCKAASDDALTAIILDSISCMTG